MSIWDNIKPSPKGAAEEDEYTESMRSESQSAATDKGYTDTQRFTSAGEKKTSVHTETADTGSDHRQTETTYGAGPSVGSKSFNFQKPFSSNGQEIVICTPVNKDDGSIISDYWQQGKIIVLNLEKMSEQDDPRMLMSYLLGVNSAIKGTLTRVSEKVYVLAPKGNPITMSNPTKKAEAGAPGNQVTF